MATQHGLTNAFLGRWLTLAGAGAILALTLLPGGGPGGGPSPFCLVCGEHGAADAVLNVLLFIPLGAGLRLLGGRLGTAVLLGAVLSLSVESCQIALVPGRDASLGDLLFNTIGAGVGACLPTSFGILIRPGKRLAARLSITAAVVMSMVFTATGFLLEPTFPNSAYFGERSPRLGNPDWYRGRVASARIGTILLPSGPIPVSPRVRDHLTRGDTLHIEAIAGPPVKGFASLFSLTDAFRRVVLLVGPDRNDMVLRIRTRADNARLDRPDMRARGMISGVSEGDALSVRVWRNENQQCFALNLRTQCARFALSDGWKLLYNGEWLPSSVAMAISLLWVGTLVAPIGLWYRRSVLSNVAVGVAVLSMVLFPHVFGLSHASVREILAMTGGFLAGLVAHRVTAPWHSVPPDGGS